MTKTSRTASFLSGVLGGLIVLAVGGALLATDVIDTGETVREVVQSPVTRAAAERDAESTSGDGLTVNEIYDRDGPGVVFIQARGVSSSEDSPFGQPEGGTATGSGFVLDEQGFILTNAHVVQGASEVIVTFGENNEVEAELVGADPSTDLAVLKVDPSEAELRPLELGDSGKVEVGDPAIAIGNPFGFDRTVTTGIVSALQRQIEAPNGFGIDNVIQTDASINPGNSGGPLLDAAGRVIGINSQIATGGSSGSVGIAFAVPINTAKEVVPKLKEDGEIKRAFLGVTTATVSERIAEDLNLPAKQGALVQEVVEDGPADRAGLRGGRTRTEEGLTIGGDLIVKVEDREIADSQDVADAVLEFSPGDTVTIEFFRGDRRETANVKLGERPKEAQSEDRPGQLTPPERPDEEDGGPDLFPFP